MPYSGLNEFITALENAGELIRIKEYVNPKLQITEITDRMSKMTQGGKALLFENTGSDFPLLINSLGSYKRMCMALGVEKLENIGYEIENLLKEVTLPKSNFFEKLKMLPLLGKIASWLPKSVSGRGACQEVVMNEPDITKLPVLFCWPHDGGQFVTFPMVNTTDPHTGIRNVGMYRLQVFDKRTTGMHWHRHKVGARHYKEYKQLLKRMPVVVTLGGDPVYTYAATAPLPDNIDEYMLAGFLRKKKVELVKCITQPIEIPTDVDFVIEGYVDTEEDFAWEGPFGDHTGFYSLADWFPKFHITCITHRKNAVYPATIVGIPPQEDAYIAKATERIFFPLIKMALLPEILDMNIPDAGVAHNLTLIKIEKSFPAQALKAMNAMWGAGQMMFNKILVVVDQNAEITDYKKLAQWVSKNVEVENDIVFSRGPLDILDHSSSKQAFGSKMCIDATLKMEEEKNFSTKNENIFQEKEISSNEIRNIKGVVDINSKLLEEGISLLVISIDKNLIENTENFFRQLSDLQLSGAYKFIAVLDAPADIFNLEVVAWLAVGNIDPQRDCYFFKNKFTSKTLLFINATRKTLQHDNFQRDWPNIIAMDTETIKWVDENKQRLNLSFLPNSPSLPFLKMLKGEGAIAEKFVS